MSDPLVVGPSNTFNAMIISIMVVVLAVVAVSVFLVLLHVLLNNQKGKNFLLYPIFGQYVGFASYLSIRGLIAADFLRHNAYRWTALSGDVSVLIQILSIAVMIGCTAWLFIVLLNGRASSRKIGIILFSIHALCLFAVLFAIYNFLR